MQEWEREKHTRNITLTAPLRRATQDRVLDAFAASRALADCVCDAAAGAGEGGDKAGDLL